MENSDKQRKAIGIDLGLTYSSVATLSRNNTPDIININGSSSIPSIVSFVDTVYVGKEAKEKAPINPEATIYDVKRFIGRKFDDVKDDIKRCNFKVDKGQDGYPRIIIPNKPPKRPEDVSAEVLKKLKTMARESIHIDFEVKDAVITVPADFDDNQRQATKIAAEIAGLNVLQLLDEPIAAAIAYGIRKSNTTSVILVYDFGGGTFDVSLLEISGNQFKVLATGGDAHLGGQDFDNNMVDFFFNKEKLNEDIRNDRRAMHLLRDECERAKISLSSNTKVHVFIQNFYNGNYFKSSIMRSEFESMNKELFDKTLESVNNVMKIAKKEKKISQIFFSLVALRRFHISENSSKIILAKNLATPTELIRKTQLHLARRYKQKYFSAKVIRRPARYM